jgi:NAD(P)-dependent dehydrogenase (short-subunit alcohol dehydrogenase family)
VTVAPAEVLSKLFDVRGTRVVVTGAAAGLGFAMAEVLAECGARLTLADIHAERLEEAPASPRFPASGWTAARPSPRSSAPTGTPFST